MSSLHCSYVISPLFWWFLYRRTSEDANTSCTHRSAGPGRQSLLKTIFKRYLVQRDRSGWVGDNDMVAVSLRFDPLNAWISQSLTWNKSAQRVSLIQRGHAGREESGARRISREKTSVCQRPPEPRDCSLLHPGFTLSKIISNQTILKVKYSLIVYLNKIHFTV